MKKWTVVIEITDEITDGSGPYTKQEIESFVSDSMQQYVENGIGFQIFETIEAPYGPQHPDGVFICDSSRKGNFRQ